MSYKLVNINENLKLLNHYPFQRLNDLLKGIESPKNSNVSYDFVYKEVDEALNNLYNGDDNLT